MPISCRNRHCPKCQGAAAREWLAERAAELLPVGYFHLVFTLPGPIADVAYQNKAVIYDLLFKAAAEATNTRHRCRLSLGNDHPHADQRKSPPVAPKIPSHRPQPARPARQPYPCFVLKKINPIALFKHPNPNMAGKSP